MLLLELTKYHIQLINEAFVCVLCNFVAPVLNLFMQEREYLVCIIKVSYTAECLVMEDGIVSKERIRQFLKTYVQRFWNYQQETRIRLYG